MAYSEESFNGIPMNIWCYGPPGSGMREYLTIRFGCHVYFHKPFCKTCYSTYADEPVFCLVNYSGNSPYQRYTLTRWTSGTPIPLRTRQLYFRCYARPKIICVISTKSPQEIFQDHPTLLRRIMDRFLVYRFPLCEESKEQKKKEDEKESVVV